MDTMIKLRWSTEALRVLVSANSDTKWPRAEQLRGGALFPAGIFLFAV